MSLVSSQLPSTNSSLFSSTEVDKRDLDITRYNVPFLLNPFVSLYTSRGCPALCTFCLWPQTHSGHRWRLRSSDDVANEVRYAKEQFPQIAPYPDSAVLYDARF